MAIVGESSSSATAITTPAQFAKPFTQHRRSSRGQLTGASQAESSPSTRVNSPRDSASGCSSDSTTSVAAERRNRSTKTEMTGGAPGQWPADFYQNNAAAWYMPEAHYTMPGMTGYQQYQMGGMTGFDQYQASMMMAMNPPFPPSPKVSPHTPVSQASTQALTPTSTTLAPGTFFEAASPNAAGTDTSEELTHLMVGGESVPIEKLKLFLIGASSPDAKLPSPEEMVIRLVASAPLRYED